MNNLFGVDWAGVFLPNVPLAEIFVRGTLVYLVLFGLLRMVLNRVAGTLGLADLLMIVLIADAAQNAMAGNYNSFTDGFLLVATIVFWNYTLNWLGFRFPRLQRFVRPPPLLLVSNGRMVRRNMKQELITEEELLSMLRKQGVEDIAKVKKAFIEGDGDISILLFDGPSPRATQTRKQVV